MNRCAPGAGCPTRSAVGCRSNTPGADHLPRTGRCPALASVPARLVPLPAGCSVLRLPFCPPETKNPPVHARTDHPREDERTAFRGTTSLRQPCCSGALAPGPTSGLRCNGLTRAGLLTVVTALP